METNVGVLDGAARLISGLLLLAASYEKFGALPDNLVWITWLLGCALVLTGLFHHCFIYRMLGMSSCAYGPSPGKE
ncbi:MAG TPA: DUF2892 domain-containing protein [Hyphomicrobiales bacterium]|nr:DUF2892 domain-containing protein [Hyphomicrobiales bacterium]